MHGAASRACIPLTWNREWGIADPQAARAGLTRPGIAPPARQVTLLQLKAETLGKRLGRTTGWIHRATLKKKGVEMIGGVHYERIDERGPVIRFGARRDNPRLLEVDSIVRCAGQEPRRELAAPLLAGGARIHRIGGADVAAELDAKRAIDQAAWLAATL